MRLLPRPIDLLNKTLSLKGLRVTYGIAYGAHARQKLDIYYAPADGQTGLPVLVFFYGGSWQGGQRADYRFVAAILARQGFVVVVPDYRLYPEVKFPEFLYDSGAAVAWVADHIVEYHGNPAEIFLLGHSAGAYNAVMLALAPDYLTTSVRLAGVIGLSGPYDFLPLKDPKLKDVFSTPRDIRQTQPVTYANRTSPPMFLASGAADSTVMPRNTTALAARLSRHGVFAQAKIYPRLGHIGMILALLPYLSWRAPVLRELVTFVSACRSGAGCTKEASAVAPIGTASAA
jgi:acetyl esterase/lipase